MAVPSIADFPKLSPEFAQGILEDSENEETEALLEKERQLGRPLTGEEIEQYYAGLPDNRETLINYVRTPNPTQQNAVADLFQEKASPRTEYQDDSPIERGLQAGALSITGQTALGLPEFVAETVPAFAGAAAQQLTGQGGGRSILENTDRNKANIEKYLTDEEWGLVPSFGNAQSVEQAPIDPSQSSFSQAGLEQGSVALPPEAVIKDRAVNFFTELRDMNDEFLNGVDEHIGLSPSRMFGEKQIPVLGAATDFAVDNLGAPKNQITDFLRQGYSDDGLQYLAGNFIGQMIPLALSPLMAWEAGTETAITNGLTKVGEMKMARDLTAGALRGMRATGIGNEGIARARQLVNGATRLTTGVAGVTTASGLVGMPLSIIQATDKEGNVDWEQVGENLWLDVALPASVLVGGKALKLAKETVVNPKMAFNFSQSTKRLTGSFHESLQKMKGADNLKAREKSIIIQQQVAEAQMAEKAQAAALERDLAAESGERFNQGEQILKEEPNTGSLKQEDLDIEVPGSKGGGTKVAEPEVKEKAPAPKKSEPEVEKIKSEAQSKINELKQQRSKATDNKARKAIDRELSTVRQERDTRLGEYKKTQKLLSETRSSSDKQIQSVKKDLSKKIDDIKARREALDSQDLTTKARTKQEKKLAAEESLVQSKANQKINRIESNFEEFKNNLAAKPSKESLPENPEAKIALEKRIAEKEEARFVEKKVEAKQKAANAAARQEKAKAVKAQRKFKKELKTKYRTGDIVETPSGTGRYQGKVGEIAVIRTPSGKLQKINRNKLKAKERAESLVSTIKGLAGEQLTKLKERIPKIQGKSIKKLSERASELIKQQKSSFNKFVKGAAPDSRAEIIADSINPKEVAQEYLRALKDKTQDTGNVGDLQKSVKAAVKEANWLDPSVVREIGEDSASSIKRKFTRPKKSKASKAATLDNLVEAVYSKLELDKLDTNAFDTGDVRQALIEEFRQGSKEVDSVEKIRTKFEQLTGEPLNKKLAEELSSVVDEAPKNIHEVEKAIADNDKDLEDLFDKLGKGEDGLEGQQEELFKKSEALETLRKELNENQALNNRVALNETKADFEAIDKAVAAGQLKMEDAKKIKQELLKIEDDMRSLVDPEDLDFERKSLLLELDELNNKFERTGKESDLEAYYKKLDEYNEFDRLYGDEIHRFEKEGIIKADDEADTNFKKFADEETKLRQKFERKSNLEKTIETGKKQKYGMVRCGI